MIVEGKGSVAPQPRNIAMTDHVRRAIFLYCRPLNHYDQSVGAWARGMTGEMQIPFLGSLNSREAPIYLGKCGEWAVSEAARAALGADVPPLDLGVRRGGDDGCDLRISGMGLQAKTARVDRGCGLVRIVRSDGKEERLGGEVHVFCVFAGGADMIVSIRGWVWNRELRRYPLVPARYHGAGHFNLEIPYTELLPMNRLWAEIQSRREAA